MLKSLFRDFCILSLGLGLIFFAASLTPSLIPRGALVQGILGGVVTALGYLTGRIIALIRKTADLPWLHGRLRVFIEYAALAGCGTVLAITLAASLGWQNDLRAKMAIPSVEEPHLVKLTATAFGTFFVCFVAGRILASLFRLFRGWFYRRMPPRRANVLGFLTFVLVLFVVTRDGLMSVFIESMDETYENAQMLFDRAPPAPGDPRMTGSNASLIDWSEIGAPGRDFITGGPDANAISAFIGRPAMDPIRVYVGRANADTPQARADLALAELRRTGAFDRAVLIVTSPTGTGWMDPGSHDPIEYMHAGDIATVSVQYSYLQSPLALIFETDTGLEQATALLETVHDYWKTLPRNARPRLYVHGLSLGAWSSMHATNLFRLVDDPINGAFWAGPPFPSNFWRYVQQARVPGSPWVAPVIGNGSLVRYASNVLEAAQTNAPWGDMRIVFLQYSSDPIVFFETLALFRPPVWMTEPPAFDVSEHLRFVPVVTQLQLALDMALGFGAPAGHGHAYYTRDYIAPWAEVTAPEGWNDKLTQRLIAHCDTGVKSGCRN